MTARRASGRSVLLGRGERPGLSRSRVRAPRDGIRPPGRSGTLVVLLAVTALALIGIDTTVGRSPLDGLRGGVASAVAPVQDLLGAAARPVRALAVDGTTARDARVDALEAEVTRLRAQLRSAEVDRARAAELDALLELTELGRYPTVPAQVVAVSPAQQDERTVTIDVGAGDGIEPDMTVLNGDGLVGRVLTVTATTAVVQLAIDHASQVGVRLAGSAELGLARGRPADDALGVVLLDPLAPMADGDVVVTFGSPGGRPFVPGVPVGVLRQVDDTYGAAERTAVVVPFVDFTSLDLVGVVVAPPREDPRDLLVAVVDP